jgi:hypothetical protein
MFSRLLVVSVFILLYVDIFNGEDDAQIRK